MPDYPDFTTFSYINIIEQTLERVLMRPTYGGALYSYFFDDVVASSTNNIISIEGEGMIYGGNAWVDGDLSVEGDQWLSVIDGVTHTSHVPRELLLLNLTEPQGSSPGLTYYDETNFNAGFILPSDITFEESFLLQYKENLTHTPSVWVKLIYALV